MSHDPDGAPQIASAMRDLAGFSDRLKAATQNLDSAQRDSDDAAVRLVNAQNQMAAVVADIVRSAANIVANAAMEVAP